MRKLIALASVLAVAACTGDRVASVQPQFQVSLAPLDFGTVPVLQSKSIDLKLQNLGRAPLNLTHVFILDYIDGAPGQGQAVAFDFGAPVPKQLSAGESAQVTLVFKPPAEQTFGATLHLESDDPLQPAVDLALTGLGSTHASIEVEATGHPGQQSIELGRVGEGQVALAGVDVLSRGTADLLVDGLTLDGPPGLSFHSSARTPVTVEMGQTLTLQLAYAPPEGAVSPLEASLTVHSTDSAHQTVVIPIHATVNRAPKAVIADPGPLAPGQVVTLDGSASAIPDGDDPIAFADADGNAGWTLTRAPINSLATIAPGDSARPQITLDLPGQYVARLIVTDHAGLQTLHPAEVTLLAKPAQALVVELVWDNADTDLDLHFLPEGAAFEGPLDCWANNKQPDLGVLGDPADDPVLARDALDHFGPEEVAYDAPVSGTYQAEVVFFSAHGSATPQTHATVRVYEYGEVVAEYSKLLPQAGQTWSALKIAWPSGDVTKVDTVQ